MYHNGKKMRFKKILLVYILLILFTPVITIVINADSAPPTWDKNWSYRKEIVLPISTNNSYAIFQPIDVDIKFDNLCWAQNEIKHSVRVICWYKNEWHELESQIYDLDYSKPNFISRCGLVFLIPEFADGTERYFVYYDNTEKKSPNYPDHVNVEDSYYYFEPISGISAEGDYYKIIEDGYVVYGIGQKGKVLYRKLSQVVIKEKPKTEDFGLIESDIIASFYFSYHDGFEEEDEISSDYCLVSKEITVDGNLMVEFRIVSESEDENLRTSNVYKYYYCPNKNKRLNVHVTHQVFNWLKVKGIINVDGRYGAIISYRSKSEKVQKMRFGEILPFLHCYDENNKLIEYEINQNPENKEREWIVAYSDDVDLGEKAWLSYDEGKTGKAHAVIFSSNKDIIQTGIDERDGIQLKVTEKEYLDALGAEIDYAAINFGRNSYEKGGNQDLDIPDDLFIEYDAEFYTSEEGGYLDIIKESEIYRTLIKHRHETEDDDGKGDQYIYRLGVIPRWTGEIFSHPLINNLVKINLSYVYAELYQNDDLISIGYAVKPLLGAPVIMFPKLATGKYIVKVFLKILNSAPKFIGFKTVEINEDKTINVLCTWPKDITILTRDQNGNYIENTNIILYKNETIIASNITTGNSDTVFTVPINIFQPYILKAYYKGFKISDEEIGFFKNGVFKNNIDIRLNLYDLNINITDELGLPPGVNVNPYISSSTMDEKTSIIPREVSSGKYLFTKIPSAFYDLHISYGSFSDMFHIKLPNVKYLDIKFRAKYDLSISLLDSRGSSIDLDGKKMTLFRDDIKIIDSAFVGDDISLPPGKYTVKIYYRGSLIGVKNINLITDKNIKVATKIESVIPLLVSGLVLVFIAEMILLLIFKKISLNTFLKLFAMSLIFLSLFYPWWSLYATNDQFIAEKKTEMFIIPQTMIEETSYNQTTYIELATVPEIFTSFLGGIIIIICSGLFLIGLSFIPNIVYKKRYSTILISASVLFFVLVTSAYTFGMSKLTELSLGSLQGDGILDVVLPDGITVYMKANWGLGIGFYLILFAVLITIFAGVIDYFKKIKKIK